jgi:PEP-CTERM motif-containing protein
MLWLGTRLAPHLAHKAINAARKGQKGENMKGKIFRLMAVAVMLVGMAVLIAPSVGQAITITKVEVVVGGSGVINIWTYPIILAPGESALLSQTGPGANQYNFDTSDFCIPPAVCGPPSITVTTDLGVFVYSDSTNVLGVPVPDTLADPPKETREYVAAAGGSPLLALFIGYADDAHLQASHPACAPNPNEIGPPNCRPDPFSASPGLNHFQAVAVSGGCLGATSPCFDAGVLRFIAQDIPRVPEPSTLLLLGAGLVGLAAWGRKRMQI